MQNPYTDPQNYTYDYDAILEYLNKFQISPYTGNPLYISDLKPNQDLKHQIDQLRDQIPDENKYRETSLSIKNYKKINPQILLKFSKKNTTYQLSITPPSSNIPRPPNYFDICCVIDVSGSMNDEARIQGDTESAGLSVLDIVKHSVKTIIVNLRPEDRLSIVTFHSQAKREIELTYMDKKGKEKVQNCLDTLTPLNSTNLWQGLEYGLDVLNEKNSQNLNFLMVFTDGVPNINPPRGHLQMLQKYRKDNKEKIENCIINMFGFGYNLDSELLNELAIEGNGAYAFIPDASFVGTVFVNAFAQMLSSDFLGGRNLIKIYIRQKQPLSHFIRKYLNFDLSKFRRN
ncbi:von willebrand factor type a domain protein [Ichthyophthirius multifiliis]|uniref:von willebrand factor type a domain protein n=1 Tax=Ichthyophthirius multifiliis TaxID=5932 RepID=G0R2E6_ICHMU|nr:von willebrand factor type a domain protein [Ichthyophthirius multifiliis]EGR28365.1 von willebrand factor type a domain protein [Ichthyophthirius multifiliis]|eukprot:XP_004027710.1 von willebrand factor type a domain protein [Ichthyophthirius multifiliis]